ncbi:MAG: hypothetical protein GYA62_05120 [Bacteroidales bacterium]|nr:hypothetical protein [Bacteroidales bacterium]
MLLARKISRAKWDNGNISALSLPNEIKADAITLCIKTNKNELSVWECDSDNALLAIASTSENLAATDIVMISKDDLQRSGIKLSKTLGNTPIEELKENHYDLTELNFEKLGIIASNIIKAIINNNVRRYSIRDIATLINKAINEKKLDPTKLKEKLRSDVVKFSAT